MVPSSNSRRSTYSGRWLVALRSVRYRCACAPSPSFEALRNTRAQSHPPAGVGKSGAAACPAPAGQVAALWRSPPCWRRPMGHRQTAPPSVAAVCLKYCSRVKRRTRAGWPAFRLRQCRRGPRGLQSPRPRQTAPDASPPPAVQRPPIYTHATTWASSSARPRAAAPGRNGAGMPAIPQARSAACRIALHSACPHRPAWAPEAQSARLPTRSQASLTTNLVLHHVLRQARANNSDRFR